MNLATLGPSLQAAILRRAKAAGSTATTVAGAWRAIRANVVEGLQQRLARPQRPAAWPLFCRGNDPCARGAYQQAEAARCSDPEAKRAQADRQWGDRWARRLRRQAAKLSAAPAATPEALRAWSDGLERTRAAHDEIIRQLNVASRAPLVGWSCDAVHALPVGEIGARNLGVTWDGRARRTVVVNTRHPTRVKWRKAESEYWGGRWRTTVESRCWVHVRTCALIDPSDARRLVWVIHDRTGIAVLPAGYEWSTDPSGVCAVRVGDGATYHPSAAEIAIDGANPIVHRLGVNATVRAERAAQEAAEAAEAAELLAETGAMACAADSLTAGNCAAGTAAWCRRARLRADEHVPLSTLLETRDERGRARMVAFAAARRHRIEMGRGYCVVAEHRAPAVAELLADTATRFAAGGGRAS